MIIETKIMIHAPRDRVWQALINFNAYQRWNPFITQVVGEGILGARLAVDITPPGGKTTTFRPVITRATPGQALRWVGVLGAAWLFRGEHYFQLNEINQETTELIHGEIFSGALVSLFRCMGLKDTIRGFELMNVALAEQLTPGRSPTPVPTTDASCPFLATGHTPQGDLLHEKTH